MAGHKLDLATNFSWSDAGKKGEQAPTTNNTVINQTNNTLNISKDSLPPTLTLDEWRAQFIETEKIKGNPVGDDAVDIEKEFICESLPISGSLAFFSGLALL